MSMARQNGARAREIQNEEEARWRGWNEIFKTREGFSLDDTCVRRTRPLEYSFCRLCRPLCIRVSVEWTKEKVWTEERTIARFDKD